MSLLESIRRKRDGGRLDAPDIAAFVSRLADGSIEPEQAAALAMAIYLRGMDFAETGALTAAMARSGTILDWAGMLSGPVLDKHSTGGIGDKVSLMLAPIVAACGGYVPMISGRGLGHTGGTLDKLASIPGYDPFPGLDRLRQVVRDVGCAIIGQTDDLAPADRRLYAVRDVTATIESTPLITASILSKKVAAGLDGLVMDIKIGSGAFMATEAEARLLSASILGTAAAMGLPARTLITDMGQTLGTTAGNAVEVGETIRYLKGDRDPRLDEVVLALAAEMLLLGRLDADRDAARARAEAALTSGCAAETFARMVAALGGPTDLIDHPERRLAAAPVILPVFPEVAGHLVAVDGKAIGRTIIGLGGGRTRIADRIDPRVGFTHVAPIGAAVGPDRPLAMIHAATPESAARGLAEFRRACIVGEITPPQNPVVHAPVVHAVVTDF
ncbi:thymidine phosphorylase [Sphingomonas oleivorans]|uniref:Thymidine phosphorylase n=1 Tax=Sphingomonas oleivorans TaxID=1735121 RepID=A0A2T5G1P4_9SPHN|nr:thymidine phosphorylase [Sphingomonas oleivorans]PTQ13077.1 thymidine phosphorylase [Sphingomonas oleivorans]